MENKKNVAETPTGEPQQPNVDILERKQIEENVNANENYKLVDIALSIVYFIRLLDVNPQSFMDTFKMEIEPDRKGNYGLTENDLIYLLKLQGYKFETNEFKILINKVMQHISVYKSFTLLDKVKMVYRESYHWLTSTENI